MGRARAAGASARSGSSRPSRRAGDGALELWRRHYESQTAALADVVAREERLVAQRRLDLLHRVDEQVRTAAPERRRARSRRARVVVAHRHPWVLDRLTTALEDRDADVLSATGDGAHALAALIVSQPDALVVGDSLVMLSGVDLLHGARLFSPGTLAVAYGVGGAPPGALLEAGARAELSRSAGVEEVVQTVLRCLAGGPR